MTGTRGALTLGTAVTAATCSLAAAQPVVVENSGFELGPVGRDVDIEGWFEIDSPDIVEPGGYAANVDGPFVIADGIPASPDGGRMAVLRNSPYMGLVEGVWQDLDGLILGRQYRLAFYQANAGLRDERPGRSDEVGPGHFEVLIGSDVFESPTMTFDGFGEQTWQTVVIEFEATETDPFLWFNAAGFVPTSSSGRLALDGVHIQLASCSPADLAEPFGQLDFSDVVAFLTAFSAQDDPADLAPPLGTFDFSDVVTYLTLFSKGCP